MAKQYTIAGRTTWKGQTKIRFGNVDRMSIMVKEGQTDIIMLKLSEKPLDKRDLVVLMQTNEKFQDEISQQLIKEFLGTEKKADAKVGDEPQADAADKVADTAKADKPKAKGKQKEQVADTELETA